MRETVIIGLGNPILTDDSVGIYIARRLSDLLTGIGTIDVTELYAGGIRLLDALVGYDEALVIDAMITDRWVPGDIVCFSPDESFSTRNTLSVHDMDLSTALRFGRTVGMPLPDRITIWGIEAQDVETFSEHLTEPVADAVPRIIRRIVSDVLGPAGMTLCDAAMGGSSFRKDRHPRQRGCGGDQQ